MELLQFLFDIPDVDSFLSQRLCQDPLERFFGCQRQRGGVHENPNAAEFMKNIQAIRVIGSLPHSYSGNCRGSYNDVGVIDPDPLKKRRRSSVQQQPVVSDATGTDNGRTCVVM